MTRNDEVQLLGTSLKASWSPVITAVGDMFISQCIHVTASKMVAS